MVVLIVLLCFLAVFLIFYALIIAPREQAEAAVKERVQSLRSGANNQIVDELDKSLAERFIYPWGIRIQNFIKNHTPNQIYNNVLKKAELVADSLRGGVNGFMVLWFVSMVSIPLLTAYRLFVVSSINPVRALVGILVAFAVGVLLPILYLRYLLVQRRQTLLENLPDILDLLAVSVQAGLGLDGALQKVVEKMKNPLSIEMQRMLRELRMGMTRRQALERLAERCEIMEISMFTSAVIQSDRMGVGIAQVIEVQAENMRDKKIQIIREKAAKMPLKLLFPLIIFIFPTVFIVVLGPRILSLLNIMSK